MNYSDSHGNIKNKKSIRKTLEGVKNTILGLVYPANIYCISCARPIDDKFPYSLCPTCARKISWANENTCVLCGKSIDEDQELCQDCQSVDRDFDKGITVSNYSLVEREIIHDFKFRDKSYLKDNLALLMAEKLEVDGLDFNCVLAVPLHKNKLRQRGYNQAELLAGEIAKLTGVDHYKDGLVRTVDTKPLSGLDYHTRKITVENVFQLAEWVKIKVKDKDILLVDDILTTGSTTSACSRVLKEAGARKVYVVSFASGSFKS